jgi:TetR/AcrR family transcriptional regulator, cholesterol catabolism regulator
VSTREWHDSMANKSGISRRRAAALSEGGAEYAAKRNELIRVAANLFRERGYGSTSLNDIAGVAGLDRATVYYYVGSKEELFREAVQGLLDDNVVQAEGLVRAKLSPQEKLEKIIELLVLGYDRNYPYAYVYIQQDMQNVADARTPWAKEMALQTHRFEKAVMSVIQEGVKSGAFRGDVPVDLMANAVFGVVNWTHRWYKPGGKHTPQAVAESFCKLVMNGFIGP